MRLSFEAAAVHMHSTMLMDSELPRARVEESGIQVCALTLNMDGGIIICRLSRHGPAAATSRIPALVSGYVISTVGI
jgi:hypothetical protein